MKIISLIKQVPDTSIALKINAEATDIVYQDVPWVINPYDEYAVEEALRIKEKLGGSVTLISIGPDRVTDILRGALAMGADEAIHLKDAAFDGSDAYSIAFILSKVLQLSGFDIIICGKQAVDDGWGQVGAALAEMLNITSVSSILKLEVAEDRKHAIAHREIDEGLEIVKAPLPALFTAQQGLNKPRYASLPGIMKAKKKEIKILDAGSMGVSPDEVGRKASRIEIKRLSYPPARKQGKILQGDAMNITKELVNLLRSEAKVI